ncbi:glycosyltransferase family 2 protein [Roseovarius sp. SK2]|uniref:glycosyltransferase family 2 protein n=1 Tax=Roseovarius TaxID=74030 RepID=UPI00237A4F85|nr:glycosyltransferase family 2 protein [Roseovarius sp. SK2]MDD9726593.1 glycosyltransferase family 2 protein [Roseovarius sp. SK2]
MKNETISVAFVLPCLNEVATLEKCILRAQVALAEIREKFGLSGEVIVADNGSTDGSQDIARRAGARVVDVPERGYGAALLAGFGAAKSQYLVMGDSDCSYDFVEAVPMIEELLNGADLCMGNRFRGGIKPGAMPWKNRYIGNPALSGLLRFLFKTDIGDAHCGLRALTAPALEGLNLSSSGMEFASEMLLKSVLLDYRIAEVPVTLSPDQRGRDPHLNPWRDGMRHLIYMLLLSPSWLFMVPGLALGVLGLVLMTALLSVGGDDLVQIGFFFFGSHWAVMASAAMVISVQTIIMGLFAQLYNYKALIRRPSKRAIAFLTASRLEYWLLAGLLLIAGGLAWISTITLGWIASDYAGLSAMRSMIAAGTMCVIGAQVFFAGFLMSVVSGNRSQHLYAASV